MPLAIVMLGGDLGDNLRTYEELFVFQILKLFLLYLE